MGKLETCKVLTARVSRLLREFTETDDALKETMEELTPDERTELEAWAAASLGQPTPPASEPPCDSADSGRDGTKGTTR